MNGQSMSKPGSAMSSQIMNTMIPQEKCLMDPVQRQREKCDKVLTYECYSPETKLAALEVPRIIDCSISIQHFAHCPALKICETKNISKNAISILEESFITYIESSKAKSFQGNFHFYANGFVYPK